MMMMIMTLTIQMLVMMMMLLMMRQILIFGFDESERDDLFENEYQRIKEKRGK